MARGGTKEGLRGWRKKGRGRRGRGGWGGANCSALGTEVGGSYRGGRGGGGGGRPGVEVRDAGWGVRQLRVGFWI